MAGRRETSTPNLPARGPGRPAGSINKIGAQAKENIIAVFDGLGGTDAMVKWARRNKTEFYKLYARLMPTYVMARVDIHDASELSDGELARIACSSSAGTAGETAGVEGSNGLH